MIVIGGGPAGSTSAGFLAKMGRKVLLLEKERFPRHHIGESMIASTIDILAEIGLEPKLNAAGFPVKSGGCFIWGERPDPWCIRFDEIPGRPTSFQVKRDVFDTILLDHASEIGVDVRQQARVSEVLVDGGRVSGVRFEEDGVEQEARSPYVIDASGLSAVVANKLSYREPAEELKNMALYGYWQGSHPAPAKLGGDLRPADRNNIIIKMLDTGWLWFIPLGFGDLISVGYVTQRDRLPEARGRAALEDHYHDRVRASDEFQYLLSNSHFTGDFYTIKDWSYRSAAMAGPGYFAVGDAACFVDPILSSGVYLAVLYAKMCAAAVHTSLEEPSQEPLMRDWYEAMYADTYTDYLEMARLWYHGDRRVQKWFHQAHDQLDSEVGGTYTDTERTSFIGLATGNAHSHPDYVLLRQLPAFPLPLYLRKDARSGFHREAHAALLAHADRETLQGELVERRQVAELGMAAPVARRRALAAMFQQRPEPVLQLDPDQDMVILDETSVSLSPGVRLSLEIIEDRVVMVLTTAHGQRRILSPAEQALLRALEDRPTLRALRREATAAGVEPSFVDEIAAAAVLTGA